MTNQYSTFKNITHFPNREQRSKPNIKLFRITKSRKRKINGYLGMGSFGR